MQNSKVSAIDGINGRDSLPNEAVFAALVGDLRDAQAANKAHIPSKRLNAAKLGFQAVILKTARELPSKGSRSFKTALIEMNEKWGETVYWAAIKRTSRPVTAEYLLAAFDLRIDEFGEIVRVPEHLRVFNDRWVQTFWMGLVITFLCVVMGYPLAYLLAHLPTRISNLLMILVLLPFWVSILVRTTAWIVLLQNEGVLNDLGLYLGLWTERLQLNPQPVWGLPGDVPRPSPLHGVDPLRGHETDTARVSPRRAVSRCKPHRRFRENLRSADHSRHRRGCPVRVYPLRWGFT